MSTYDDFSRTGLVPADKLNLPEVEGLELPTVQEHSYVLDDDDAQECRWITEGELEAVYVDNNIYSIRILLPDLWSDIEQQTLTLAYENGLSYEVLLGDIEVTPGPAAERYRKWGGIAFPADGSGRVLLDETNTPRLVAIKQVVLHEWREVQEKRLELAEIAYSFSQIISLHSQIPQF